MYPYRGTSLTRKRNPLGTYRKPRDLRESQGGGRFLMGAGYESGYEAKYGYSIRDVGW